MFQLILVRSINLFVQVVEVLILVRVLMSWFRPRTYSRDTQWFYRLEDQVHRLTEPLLAPIRRLLPPAGFIDFSPLVLLLLLDLARRLIFSLLFY